MQVADGFAWIVDPDHFIWILHLTDRALPAYLLKMEDALQLGDKTTVCRNNSTGSTYSAINPVRTSCWVQSWNIIIL